MRVLWIYFWFDPSSSSSLVFTALSVSLEFHPTNSEWDKSVLKVAVCLSKIDVLWDWVWQEQSCAWEICRSRRQAKNCGSSSRSMVVSRSAILFRTSPLWYVNETNFSLICHKAFSVLSQSLSKPIAVKGARTESSAHLPLIFEFSAQNFALLKIRNSAQRGIPGKK